MCVFYPNGRFIKRFEKPTGLKENMGFFGEVSFFVKVGFASNQKIRLRGREKKRNVLYKIKIKRSE